MDSPGGYQLVGRTIPIWNTFGRAGPFTAQKPWLLEFFDQVRPHHNTWTSRSRLPGICSSRVILFLYNSVVARCCAMLQSDSHGRWGIAEVHQGFILTCTASHTLGCTRIVVASFVLGASRSLR
jgi:hypothetical protein